MQGGKVGLASPLPFRLLILAGLVLAFSIRLATADYSPLFDEFATLYFAEQPFSHLWGPWMERETNPPLFYTLVKLWRGVFDGKVVSLRMLPILIGTAQIGVMAWLCARYHSRTAAVIVVLMLAVSTQHIFISHYVRGYGLGMLGVSVSLAGLMLWWEGDRRRMAGIALYGIGAVIAFYSHTTMICWQVVAPLVALGFRAREILGGNWRALRDLVLMGLLAGIPSLWWIYITLLQITGPSAINISWIGEQVDQALLKYYWHNSFFLRVVPFFRIQLLAVTGLLLASLIWQRGNRLVQFCAALSAGCLLFLLVANIFQPIATGRVLVWLMLFPAIITACGIAGLPRWWMRLALGGAAVLLLAWNFHRGGHRLLERDWRGAVLTTAQQPGSALLIQHNSTATVLDQVCKLEFDTECPFKVVLMYSGQQSNYWTHSFSKYPELSNEQVIDDLRDVKNVYVINYVAHRPVDIFSYKENGREVNYDIELSPFRYFFAGPFEGSSFAIREVPQLHPDSEWPLRGPRRQ